ncbi:MAG: agmatinase [Phycisphaerales bacterium]
MSERKTTIPNSRVQPRFGGIATFGRYPRIEDAQAKGKSIDWAIVGAPFDGGVTFRPGTRFGPRAIREQSQYLKHFSIEHAVDVPGVLSLADAGDAPIKPYSVKETLDGVVEHLGGIGDQSSKLMLLGGDHSLVYAGMKAAWNRQGQPAGGLACVHFDSHMDTLDTVWGEKWNHATPFRRLIEEGILNPKKMVSIGIKGPLNTEDDLDYAREQGIELVPHTRWEAEGFAPIQSALDRIGAEPVYLSYDIDCVDPVFAPGTGTPCVGGFTSAEALDLLRGLKGINLVGADVVEVLPDRDVAGNTALLAAHIVFEIIALDAATR